jgi:hypothetical protein
VPGDADEGGREFANKARTKKIIAGRARQKILLPVPVLAGKILVRA